METHDKKLNRRLKTWAGFPQAWQQELLLEAPVNGKFIRRSLPKKSIKLVDEATIELLLRTGPASTSQTPEVVSAKDIDILTNILEQILQSHIVGVELM